MTCGRSEPIRIVVDTREKEPYSFPLDGVQTIRRKLVAGDYSLDGFEERVAVERKSLADFVSTVIHARSRFTRELTRLQEFEAACVVVEAGMDDILAGRYRGHAHPNAVFGLTLSIIVDFGIPVYFCGNRQIACRFLYDFLTRYHRKASSACADRQHRK